MSNLMLALTQTGTQEPGASAIDFPEGDVVVLEAGMQFVAQSHYINTTGEPLVTGDTMNIRTTTAELSTLTQLHLFVSTVLNFEIPANTADYSAKDGCVLDQNVQFLSLAPHMHQWGTRIELSIGPAGAMKQVVDVSGWTTAMRDLPPVTSFMGPDASAAGRFSAGESVELKCTWTNTESHSMRFPSEMCGCVGYFTTDSANGADLTCLGAAP